MTTTEARGVGGVPLYPGWPPSYCLRYGFGPCPQCYIGFPQWCQCKPKEKRIRRMKQGARDG